MIYLPLIYIIIKNCYCLYVSQHNKTTTQQEECSKADIVKMHEIENKVNEHFFNLFSKNVIAEKEAYLLTELLIDIQEMSFHAGSDNREG